MQPKKYNLKKGTSFGKADEKIGDATSILRKRARTRSRTPN